MATKHFFRNNSIKNNTNTVNSNRNFTTLSPYGMKKITGGYHYYPKGYTDKPKD